VQTFAQALRPGTVARVDIDPQPHATFEYGDRAQKLAAPSRRVFAQVGARPQRERVGQPHQTAGRAHFGNEHSGIGLVKLSGFMEAFGRYGESAATFGVENGAEQRRRIETRHTHP